MLTINLIIHLQIYIKNHFYVHTKKKIIIGYPDLDRRYIFRP